MPDREHDEEGERPSLRRRLSRRILGDDEGKGLLHDAREAASDVVEAAKGRPEIVRLIAREVRSYLDELGLKDDVHSLLTNYSVELKASIHLRRLAEPEEGPHRPERVARDLREAREKEGKDGRDARDGREGREGRDGKDGG